MRAANIMRCSEGALNTAQVPDAVHMNDVCMCVCVRKAKHTEMNTHVRQTSLTVI